MKKFYLLVIALLVLSAVSFGQIAYKMGDNNVSGMLGLGGYGGLYGTSTMPAIAASYEMGYNENFSIGGLAGITGSEFPILGAWKWKYTYILIGARGAYHYDLLHKDNIDTYGGAMLGYNIVSFSEEGAPVGGINFFTAGASYLSYGGFVGGRYYFSPNLAAQAELGFGIGLLTIGISYKM
jgi:hypothetical protein